MTILIKLGGSLITNKAEARSFRRESVRRIAAQIARLRAPNQCFRIIIGHGSGSFGHYEAKKYNTVAGVKTKRERRGFVQVGLAATELSLLVQREFLAAGLPVMRFQPSSMMVSCAARVTSIDIRALSLALDQNMIPLIHGDIALDRRIGGTIVSTESLFARLVHPLAIKRIILLGEVAGVLNQDGELVPRITPASIASIRPALAGSNGIDVTGGMLQKVETMISLICENPSLQVIIADGKLEHVLEDLLAKGIMLGTEICADS